MLVLVEKISLIIASVAILAICAIIFSGVLTRAIFNWSLPDAEIMVRELMIAAMILPLAYVTANRAHIAVDVFVNLMPNWVKPWVDFLGSVIGFLVLLPIAYGGWKAFNTAWWDGNYFYGEFDLPEWPGKLAFCFGYIVFVVRLAWLVFIDFKSLFRSEDSEIKQ
ncbi:TRAP transporter small permease [uncultured Shimia sp.]|uniref:TRAP transporter small permease n=1 Tax=uncultured Shimia sp. TaxID=573152 RepID=UPI0025D7B9AF|nr:TRAP transporter small permease [uncultured Shimia sp.]